MNEFGMKVKQSDENELMWKDEILIVTWTLKGVITFLLIVYFLHVVGDYIEITIILGIHKWGS
jgi:hypothetical protein